MVRCWSIPVHASMSWSSSTDLSGWVLVHRKTPRSSWTYIEQYRLSIHCVWRQATQVKEKSREYASTVNKCKKRRCSSSQSAENSIKHGKIFPKFSTINLEKLEKQKVLYRHTLTQTLLQCYCHAAGQLIDHQCFYSYFHFFTKPISSNKIHFCHLLLEQ